MTPLSDFFLACYFSSSSSFVVAVADVVDVVLVMVAGFFMVGSLSLVFYVAADYSRFARNCCCLFII